MVQTKPLLLQACGHVFHLSNEKYREAHVSISPYQSGEICADMLLLPSGQTVAGFKDSAMAAFKSQTGPVQRKLVDLQNQTSQCQFQKPFQAIVQQQKEAMRHRYVTACASDDGDFRVTELQACACQGHVQANMDLGILFDAERKLECINYFVEAHNLGHPESLLCLSKTFFKVGNHGAAVRVLLLGAACGSIQCGQALLLIREHRLYVFEASECLAALEAGLADGSIHAKYILGFVLCHSESCRDEARGRALINDAAKMRHYRGDNSKGAPLVEGSNQYAAGTLAHFETLIDQELLAILSQELMPKFLAEVGKLSLADKDARAAFEAAFEEFNPVPQRMVRKMADWLASADDEPVDEVKLERMKALCLPDEEVSKETGDE